MTTNNNNAERGFGFGFNFRVPEKMDVDGDENYVPKDPDVLQFRNELVKNILSLTDLITEKERKVELSKMIYENEVSELAELQNRKKDLIAQKGCVKKAEKLLSQKKRRRDLDGYNNQLDDYLNEPEEGKCEFINDNNRKCTKNSNKDYRGREYCNAHYNKMRDDELRRYRTHYGSFKDDR
jgi:hypothetical protein